MRLTLTTALLLFLSTAHTASAAGPPNLAGQSPLMDAPGIALPPGTTALGTGNNDDAPAPGASQVLLLDVIGNTPRVTTFASLARDVDAVAACLATATLNATVLAPLNDAMARLPRKPWEDAADYSELGTAAYAGAAGEARAERNLHRFVERHIVPRSPLPEGEKLRTVAGGEVWVERRDGRRYIQPGNVEVVDVVQTVANGEMWAIKEVLVD